MGGQINGKLACTWCTLLVHLGRQGCYDQILFPLKKEQPLKLKMDADERNTSLYPLQALSTMRSRSFSKDIYSNFLKLFIEKSLGVDKVAVCSILQVLPSWTQIGTCGGTIYHAMSHIQQLILSMTLQRLEIWRHSNIDTPTIHEATQLLCKRDVA